MKFFNKKNLATVAKIVAAAAVGIATNSDVAADSLGPDAQAIANVIAIVGSFLLASPLLSAGKAVKVVQKRKAKKDGGQKAS